MEAKLGVVFLQRLTVADEIRNSWLTSPIGNLNQIEEMLTLAS